MTRLAIAALAAALAALTAVPASAEDPGNGAYLQIMYSWQLPLPNCGTPDVFSTYAPFAIQGNRIVGLIEKGKEDAGLDLPPLVPEPLGPPQEIDYTYTCGACEVSGHITIHKVSGRVETRGGKEMLHFFVSHTEPYCQVDCPGTIQDIDCSYSETVVDEFMTPRQDGYITERPAAAKFKYAVHLH